MATSPDSIPARQKSSPGLSALAWLVTAGVIIAIFAAICIARDRGYGGPHHDEVIALLASKGFERAYARLHDAGEAPFHQIVPASEWQRFTQDFVPVSFSEVRDDVLFGDKHPPLAFWVFNRWLALFTHGQYEHAVVLVWIQIVIAAALLKLAVLQYTGSRRLALVAFAIFLAGNCAVVTATWVRQYSLFAICYALTAICAGELTRPSVSRLRMGCSAAGLGMASLLGMMTQYTFLTMSAPIHLALVVFLVQRRTTERVAIVGAGYLFAGAAFFALIPRAINHALVVSQQLQHQWHIGNALWGIPQMIVPMPSALQGSIGSSLGLAVMLAVLALGARACMIGNVADQLNRPDQRVVLAGMLGAGIIQLVMVAAGLFPGWATSPPHMCALWWLSVLALSIWLSHRSTRFVCVATTIALTGMIAMQSLYAWHCLRILPRVNTSYIQSQRPQLVCLDNLARGFVLQLTDVMSRDQPVLATDGESLRRRLLDGGFRQYDRILYMPMDETVGKDKSATIEAARQAGYTVHDLPVVHPQLFNAVLFEKKSSTSDETAGGTVVPR